MNLFKLVRNAGTVVLLLFAVAACRTDYLQDAEHRDVQLNKGLITKIISLNESKHKTRLFSELSESKQLLSKQSAKNALGKNVNYGDSVSIDTDHVVYIENGNYHNYIFKINRTNVQTNEPIENLLLTPLPDGSYKEYLIEYFITKQEQQLFESDGWEIPKSKIIMRELTSGTYNNGELIQTMSEQNCLWTTVLVGYTTCSGNLGHHNGEGSNVCHGEIKSQPVYASYWQCESIAEPPPTGSTPTVPGTPGDTPGGGDGTSCPDCPPTEPTECVEIISDPTQPSTGTGENGCTVALPIIPILSDPKPETPCEKTKALMQRPEVKAKVADLKTHTGPNEKGYKFMKDGTPPQEAPSGSDNYSVKLGDPSLLEGFHHTHPETGMFSPTDINNMVQIARSISANSNLTINDAWAGMIGPGGSHYIISFTGSFSDLQNISYFSEAQLETWLGNQLSMSVDLTQNHPSFQEVINGKTYLNNKGRAALFFETLKLMELQNIITLQEIDQYGNAFIIKQNTDGSTIAVPCP